MLKLKELRIFSALTQKDVADRLSTTQTTIGKYERGELEPSLNTLCQLADLFNCSVDYLMGRADDFGNITIENKMPAAKIAADEEKLLSVYRQLNTKNKMHVSAYAQIRLEEQDGGAPSSLRWK